MSGGRIYVAFAVLAVMAPGLAPREEMVLAWERCRRHELRAREEFARWWVLALGSRRKYEHHRSRP